MNITPILDGQSESPLYQQLYGILSRDIVSGQIPAGSRLPSIRQMAALAGVSRITVEAAYQQLVAEGFLISRERSGFFAAEMEEWMDSKDTNSTKEIDLPVPIKRNKGEHLSSRYNFHGSVVDTSHFPYALWRSCLLDAMDRFANDFAFYGDDQGEWELRVELARYLRRARTLSCEPEQIIVGTGLQQALSFLCLMLRDSHAIAAVEDPGYADARVVFQHHGYQIAPIPLEEDGLSIEALEKSQARLVYLTPAHQYPHGMVMPVSKRIRLLQWARKTGGIIIENDYDGEFRYNAKPTPSLQGMDQEGSVVYIGNFSKAFSPAVRMDYLVLPPALFKCYLESFQAYPSPVPRLQQRAMQLFMEKGYWEKHIRKMRTLYQKKHTLLLGAIKRHMPPEAVVLGHSAGLHILLEIQTKLTEQELMEAARKQDVRVYPTSRSWFSTRPPLYPRMIIGFGGMQLEDIEEGIKRLASAWFPKIAETTGKSS
ncbi:PLP-dependent aminotransferase family protein [Brevibacillus ruminantium]|uniref:PLP-dependent aminotransferase family protein n=1 Tax=Brevibacillus ruminantium TaxID=2950604 RepID=A0ABY4WIU7_9BACL|nr:PLP-dependent aminotransferase family protein [Brevibacillus ruminantium]USG67032.1 PLP-dependent aminotransferase family protein [Brevibacillus ruminantium]